MKQRYDSYKPSGIDWIGEIPAHWNVCRFQFALSDIKDGTHFSPESSEEGLPYITATDVRGVGLNYNNAKKISESDFKSLVQSGCKALKGDVLLVKDGATTGRVGYKDDDVECVTLSSVAMLRGGKSVFSKYLMHYISADYLQNQILVAMAGAAMPRITIEKIRAFWGIFPPIAEQEAIAAWLDEKCGEIDAAVAKVDREIELIDELKQSEISRVVTRGLNPDAPLRPSGIDWIGDVPEHWETCRLKHKATVTLGKMLMSEPPKDQEHLYTKERYLKSRNIGWLELELSDVEEMWFNGFEKNLYELHDNDIVVNEGGDIGKVALWKSTENSYYIQNSVHKVSLNSGEPRFLLYWLYCLSKRNYFWSIVSQVSIAHLTKEKLSNAPLIFPPISEQVAIADYLDKKCAQIDGLKEKLVKKRETLKELRQAIISEVVTGKRKVI